LTMAMLDQEGWTQDQQGVVLRLRKYGAAIKDNRIVQALLFETMTKASVVFPVSTAINIEKRDLHAITIMWELKQDQTRYRHLCPLGQGLLELVPMFMMAAPIDMYVETDAAGNRRTRIGKVEDPFGALRSGQGVPADQFQKNEVTFRAEEQLAVAGGWTAPAGTMYQDIVNTMRDEMDKEIERAIIGPNGDVVVSEQSHDRIRQLNRVAEEFQAGGITANEARRMLGIRDDANVNNIIERVGRQAGKISQQVTIEQYERDIADAIKAGKKIRRMFQ
jgi:hypothetical protein